MSTQGFIASKSRFKGGMAAGAIAISFFVMILAVAISGGFRYEIRKGIQDISGDIILTTSYFNYYSEEHPIDSQPSYIESIEALPEVEDVKGVVYRAGIVKNGEDIHGVIFKGAKEYGDSASLAVSIPSGLAKKMKLKVGDEMLSYFVGDRVKARKFKVSEIYPNILDGEDKLIIHASYDDMLHLNGWEDGMASAIEIKLKSKNLSDNDIREISRSIGTIAYEEAREDEDILVASAAVDTYAQLFDWLGLIDFNVVAILILMTLVAGFNMISGLLILLFRNIPTIGTLKTLGMTDKGICGVFLRVSARIVTQGLVIGNLLAFAFCFIQNKTHLISLNPENYFVSYVPINLNPISILIADVVASIAIMLILSLSSMFISKVDPSETVRTE